MIKKSWIVVFFLCLVLCFCTAANASNSPVYAVHDQPSTSLLANRYAIRILGAALAILTVLILFGRRANRKVDRIYFSDEKKSSDEYLVMTRDALTGIDKDQVFINQAIQQMQATMPEQWIQRFKSNFELYVQTRVRGSSLNKNKENFTLEEYIEVVKDYDRADMLPSREELNYLLRQPPSKVEARAQYVNTESIASRQKTLLEFITSIHQAKADSIVLTQKVEQRFTRINQQPVTCDEQREHYMQADTEYEKAAQYMDLVRRFASQHTEFVNWFVIRTHLLSANEHLDAAAKYDAVPEVITSKWNIFNFGRKKATA
jgi:hypothetical protein